MAHTVIITGGRVGFGKALLDAAVSMLTPKCVLATSRHKFDHPMATTISADLETAAGVDAVAESMLKLLNNQSAAVNHRPWRSILIHNSGSLEPLGKLSAIVDPRRPSRLASDLARAGWLNGATFGALTACFAAAVSGAPGPPSLVVNISSLAAVHPFPTWGAYSAGKAYREALLRVVEAEQRETERLHTLSYAPGPLDTAMQRVIREDERVDDELREQFREQFEHGELVDPAVSAEALMALLEQGPAAVDALKGRVDYYDLVAR